MQKPNHHILVCASFRMQGEPQGVCHKKGSGDFLGYIENELIDRGLADVSVTSTGCLKACDRGPILVVHPENVWYGNIDSEEKIDEILDSIEDGEICEDYVLT